MDRLLQSFPTRIYPYRRGEVGLAGIVAAEEESLPSGVFCYRLGRDARPMAMSAEEIAASLQDPFAKLLLSRGVLPLSLRGLLMALDAHNAAPDGLPAQRSFLVADGGKIPWTLDTSAVRREFRFVITRGRTGAPQPDLMTSASTNLDSEEIFLQLIAWDPVNEVFHFYQRLGKGWGWAGHSWDALADDTRGKGPFDSHANGAMVMKELRQPWIHWHSQAASIPAEALAPDDPLRSERLFVQKTGAERLEMEVVRPGIRRWNDARFKKLFQDGTLQRAHEFLRQILFTTTVNLASAPEERTQVLAGRPIHLPISFFFNDEAFLNLLRLPVAFQRPAVDGGIYAHCLERYEVSISDGNFIFPGDTHFVFVVPEPAFEDHVVLQKLVRLQILSSKLAASLLMVDFTNPVFSNRRASLLAYLPDQIHVIGGASDLAKRIIASISAQGAAADSPEAEFLENWNLSDAEWAGTFARRIEDYMSRVNRVVLTIDGFDPLFQLAESRRREFRKSHLAEFRLTTPLTNVPEDTPLLEMTPHGTVQNKPTK
jgi:hypothetical protein